METLQWARIPKEIQDHYQDDLEEACLIDEDTITTVTLGGKFARWQRFSKQMFGIIEEYQRPTILQSRPSSLVIIRFHYKFAPTDSHPEIVFLGRYIHERTANSLISGINLNYVEDDDKQAVLATLRVMDKWAKDLRSRVGWLRHQWDNYFNEVYREYDESRVESLENVREI